MPAFDGANAVTKAQAKTSKFVPEIWQDEVVATYKKNIVVAPTIKRISVVGKKGDVVHLPGFTRKNANQKVAGSPVTLVTHSGTGVQVNLDQHWEYSALIEDLTKLQGMTSLRTAYTEDAGYALARKVDEVLLNLTASWQGGSGTTAWNAARIAGDGSTLFTGTNANAVTDAGIRRLMQTLDDADVPLTQRSFVIPPVARNTMLGIARFTEQAFKGDGNTLKTGKFGEIYGMEVYITSMCPVAAGAQGARIGAIYHREALVLCEQQKPRAQAQYKLEWLGELLVMDMVFGAAEYRDNAGIAVAFAP